MNNFHSSSREVSTHYIHVPGLSYFPIWRRWCLKFTSSFYPWGPSPWAPLGATCTILATLDLLPLRMIPTKFGWNLTMHFGEEDENVKSLRTTYDGRRTTHAGQKAIAIAHLSLRLRWANKIEWFLNSPNKLQRSITKRTLEITGA